MKVLKVLLVEDDKNVTKAMIRWLARRGCEIEPRASKGGGLIALADSRFEFNAVITDWELGGGEHGEPIVSAAQNKRIPVRVFSGSPCPSNELASIWVGKADLEGLEAFLKEVRGG